MIQKQATPERLAQEIESLMNIEKSQIQVMQHLSMHKRLISGDTEDPVQAILSLVDH